MSEIWISEYLLDVKGLTTYFDITEGIVARPIARSRGRGRYLRHPSG